MSKLSSGEFNRLRLAWMATRSSFDPTQEGQILFLDEIDANVSGEESHSVGKVLKFLAQKNQIFAISHQPQLTSLADAHFLVTKTEGKSEVKKLDDEGRIQEIARIISGESISGDALSYARTLREGK
jgi:DNA repair protein RecN (Recombination protein N)